MMIEQNTNYAYKLKYMDNPTFDKVRDLSTKFYRELPPALQDELYEALNRGIDILDSEPQMTAYLFAFGKMHQAKLNYAFGKLPEEFLEQPEINIIDYGCGQALGTMCYADFLRENGYVQKVKTITLIEPSEICLKRAALHAFMFFPDAEIKTVNKSFDELDVDNIFCDEDIPTLHIFSNVLDILDFDLEGFADLIKDQIKGYNQFVCVGPYFNYADKDTRMEYFLSLLRGKKRFCKSLDKNKLDPEKAWTAQIHLFSIGELPSTEVSEFDINNGIVDGSEIIYSSDGKRLLKCKNSDLESYQIKSGTKIICDYAFDGISTLEYITIPDSVKTIGEGAFIGCTSLKEIIIPDSVTSIDGGAFINCSSLKQILIPNSVTHFDNIAFLGCSSLQQITIPNQIKKIDEWGFYGCISLQQITIPNSVVRIERYAFKGCTSLQQITIPDSVLWIGKEAFKSCKSLKQINIPKGSAVAFKQMLDKELWNKLVELPQNDEYLSTKASEEELEEAVKDEYGVLYSKDGMRLLRCSNKQIKDYSIRSHTKIICDYAFGMPLEGSCKSLQNVTIPKSITNIGKGAFYECSSLRQINIPNTVTNIGDHAFYNCKSLKQIFIPNSVKSIGNCSFFGCSALEHIIIPDSVTHLGEASFSGCESMVNITINSHQYMVIDKLIIDADEYKIVTCFGKAKNIIIPNIVKAIGNYAFYWCKTLQHISIPHSVTNIGRCAFCKCESLQEIKIPDSVTCIKDATFIACSSLKKITIPNTITTIEDDAFLGCKSLQEIKIPNSVTSIGKSAFRGCSSLTQVSIPNSVSEIGDCAFGGCESLQAITIPQGTKEKFKRILLNY